MQSPSPLAIATHAGLAWWTKEGKGNHCACSAEHRRDRLALLLVQAALALLLKALGNGINCLLPRLPKGEVR